MCTPDGREILCSIKVPVVPVSLKLGKPLKKGCYQNKTQSRMIANEIEKYLNRNSELYTGRLSGKPRDRRELAEKSFHSLRATAVSVPSGRCSR